MKQERLSVATALIMVGLIALGWLLKSGIDNFASKDRFVSVKGLAERQVNADKVIWPIVYNAVGNDLTEIYDNVALKRNIITSYLNDNGIKPDEINISAPSVFDREAQNYSQDNVKVRYNVTAVITVTSSQVTKVLELMAHQDELMKKGIAITSNYEYQTQFLFVSLNELKPEMIQEATKNARMVAQKFADDSESELGGIRTANQGQFSITSDNNTPYIKNVRVVTTIDYFLK